MTAVMQIASVVAWLVLVLSGLYFCIAASVSGWLCLAFGSNVHDKMLVAIIGILGVFLMVCAFFVAPFGIVWSAS